MEYRVPTFLTFVFREDDLFIGREMPSDDGQSVEADLDEPHIVHGGYRTNVAAAIATGQPPSCRATS